MVLLQRFDVIAHELLKKRHLVRMSESNNEIEYKTKEERRKEKKINRVFTYHPESFLRFWETIFHRSVAIFFHRVLLFLMYMTNSWFLYTVRKRFFRCCKQLRQRLSRSSHTHTLYDAILNFWIVRWRRHLLANSNYIKIECIHQNNLFKLLFYFDNNWKIEISESENTFSMYIHFEKQS